VVIGPLPALAGKEKMFESFQSRAGGGRTAGCDQWPHEDTGDAALELWSFGKTSKRNARQICHRCSYRAAWESGSRMSTGRGYGVLGTRGL
jgi:hypothetical protein